MTSQLLLLREELRRGYMEKPVLVVMAAGMGSRYGGLKQLDPVGPHGQFILDYSLYDAQRAGFTSAIFVVKRELLDIFQAAFHRPLARHMNIQYTCQELDDLPAGYLVPEGRIKPWGTAQAALSARKLVHGPFAIINADDYYGPESFRLIYDYLTSHPDGKQYEYAMVGYRVRNTVTEHGSVSRGVCEEDADGYLQKIVERTCIEKAGEDARFRENGQEGWTHLPGETVVSMNLWGFQASFLREAEARFPAFLETALRENPLKGEYYLPSVVSQLLDEKKARVKVLHSGDKWYGVTYREDKSTVVQAIHDKTAAGLYPENLWESFS